MVFGYSQSATIATNEISALMAAGSPYQGQLSFMLIGDPNNPVGGILERFPGFYIPFLDVAFNGATPPNSPYPTSIYTIQYDGIADAPQYPLNVVSDLNAVHGLLRVARPVSRSDGPPRSPTLFRCRVSRLHRQHQLLHDHDAEPAAVGADSRHSLCRSPDRRHLPARPAGARRPGLRATTDPANYANVPTPAGLSRVPNPFTVIPDLAVGGRAGPVRRRD